MSENSEVIYKALTERHADFSIAELATQTHLTEAEVQAAREELINTNRAVPVSEERLVSDTAWKRLTDTARRTLATFHKRNPYKLLLPQGELSVSLAKAATTRDAAALFAKLQADGVLVHERRGARLPEHQIVLPSHWQAAADQMIPVFVGGGLTNPPWTGNFRANFPRDVNVDAILDAVSERGELVRLGDELYISVEAFEEAKQILRRLAEANTPITVGTVRDATGSSRRIVVPLLEAMDKAGITARQGEERVLNAPSP